MDDVPAMIRKTFEPLSLPAPSKDMRAMENSEPAKQSKTATELEALILADRLNVDGCPQKGVKVTVHGIPWKGHADVRRSSRPRPATKMT